MAENSSHRNRHRHHRNHRQKHRKPSPAKIRRTPATALHSAPLSALHIDSTTQRKTRHDPHRHRIQTIRRTLRNRRHRTPKQPANQRPPQTTRTPPTHRSTIPLRRQHRQNTQNPTQTIKPQHTPWSQRLQSNPNYRNTSRTLRPENPGTICLSTRCTPIISNQEPIGARLQRYQTQELYRLRSLRKRKISLD